MGTPRQRVDVGKSLDAAARHVAERGAQLTQIRRTVLGLLYAERKAVGAYDLLFKFQQKAGRRAAPNTIYRALHFLERHRLAAPVAGQRGYVGVLPASPRTTVILFTCDQCGGVIERDASRMARVVRFEARAMGFAVLGQPLQVRGSCARCGTPVAARKRKGARAS